MFPSMAIFLMRVPSEPVAGDGQLLFGGVAILVLWRPRAHPAGRAGKWPQVRALMLTPLPNVT